MKVLVGLGNPGKKYEDTPHNMGFLVIDKIAEETCSRLRRSLRFSAKIGKAVVNGENLLLVKPQTYMNNSGNAVAAILRYYKLGPENLLLVSDDADLDFGRLRIRPDGRSGGHRGLDSVIESVKSAEFVRLRVGVGRRGNIPELEKQVLKAFNASEKKQTQEIVLRAKEAVISVLNNGVDVAMNEYNGTGREAD